MLNLLDSFGKRGVSYGLATKQADVTDSDFLSRYFVLSEFSPTFTAGKNAVAVNGSAYLQGGSEILIECLDSAGNNLFIEMAKYSDSAAKTYAYKEATAFIFSISVYNDTADGIGRLFLYGKLINGKTVKWQRNITIDKTLRNTSKVRFYQTPQLEVSSILVPVLDTSISTNLIVSENFVGSVHGLAVTPHKDTILPTVNKRNTDIDYRIVIDNPVITRFTDDSMACNSQMIGSKITLNLNTIQFPFSANQITPIQQTASFIISDVADNRTIKLSDAYYYMDGRGNAVVTNIGSASIDISYPFVAYNDATSSYLQTNIGGILYTVQQSYADVIYKNIRAFSGYVARYKIYRRSLLSNGDFTVVADEPIVVNEILNDDLTQNKFYSLLGKFYNDQHIERYWFTSSNNITLVHSPDFAVDSMFISVFDTSLLTGDDYLMVKNDSVNVQRNATYVPFDNNQFQASSGSAYDSNFMEFKANVQYLVEISATTIKAPDETSAGLEFYITSSVPAATLEPSFTYKNGIRIATLASTAQGITNQNFEKQIFFFTPKNDLFGTLTIVPYRCQAYVKNISVRVYGDDGFSPDTFITRIPWPISVANESFEIKSELLDINHGLVFSDLRVLQSFDPSGSSLIPFIPNGGGVSPGTFDLFVSGNLTVSKSITSEFGNVFIPNIGARPGDPAISQSRFISVKANGQLVFDPIVDVSGDDQYLYLSLGNASNRLVTPITSIKSLATQYDANSGRKIYWVNGVKFIENGTF